MAGVTVVMVNVKNGKELSRAHVNDDGSVTFSQDDDILPSLFDNTKKGFPNLDNTGIAKLLNKNGWSNGYIMIERPK